MFVRLSVLFCAAAVGHAAHSSKAEAKEEKQVTYRIPA